MDNPIGFRFVFFVNFFFWEVQKIWEAGLQITTEGKI